MGRFVLFTRAFDGAGNVGSMSTVEWWVDTLPPAPPVILSAPDGVSLSTNASFVFKLVGSTSPGRMSFVYNFTGSVPAVDAVVALPLLPQPSPTNDAPVSLSLSGLAPGRTYTVSIASVSQAGMRSMSSSVLAWQTLSSPPSVLVTARPDAISGSDRPAFQFVAHWDAAPVIPSHANFTYLVLLLGDVGTGRSGVVVRLWCCATL